MKRIMIKMLIYSIIVLILLCIMSIPGKVDQEKIDAMVQAQMVEARKSSEEHLPNISEELREEAMKDLENTIRNSYEHSNTFKYRFLTHLQALFIGLVIAVVIGILSWAHSRELMAHRRALWWEWRKWKKWR